MIAYISAYGQGNPHAKATVSIDLTGLIADRNARLGFSHGFHERWSAEGEASIQIPEARGGEEENGHDSMFSDNDGNGRSVHCPELRMGVRFWPERSHKGAYLGLYCSNSLKGATDIVLGCGYALGIWNGIGFTAGYELKLIEGIRNSIFSTKGIRISINYSF